MRFEGTVEAGAILGVMLASLALALPCTLATCSPTARADSDEFEARRIVVERLEKQDDRLVRAAAGGARWLAAHQEDDGSWDADGFERHDPDGKPSGGAGDPTRDVGCSAYAMLALLALGNTPEEGAHQEAVARGARWLASQQGDDGRFGGVDAPEVDHWIATLALAEVEEALATGVHRDSLLRALTVEIPAADVARAWCATAFAYASRAGVPVERASLVRLLQPLPAGEQDRALAAARLWSRLVVTDALGRDPGAGTAKDVPSMIEAIPGWKKGVVLDEALLVFGSSAAQRNAWSKSWSEASAVVVTRSQRRGGSAKGSWDPESLEDGRGGRVWATAVMVYAATAQARVEAHAPGIGGSLLEQAGSVAKFGLRRRGRRVVRAAGEGVEGAYVSALAWLARNQREDGSWGAEQGDVETTALAALAFFAQGDTTVSGGHQEVLGWAIAWLSRQQDEESGAFGVDARAHAVATEALVDAWVGSGEPELEARCAKAVAHLLDARGEDGGWSDALTTAQALVTLVQAKGAGLEVHEDVLTRGLDALGAAIPSAGDVELGAIAAATVYVGVLVGRDPRKDEALEDVSRRLEAAYAEVEAPGPLDGVPWVAWGAIQLSGKTWRKLEPNLTRKLVVDEQWQQTELEGSWDGEDRARQTALGALTIAVYFRFERIVRFR